MEKEAAEDRTAERSEVWRSNGTGGMTNQLLVVQLGPHTAPILPGTITFRPLHLCRGKEAREREKERGECREESHDARLQIRLLAMTSPQPVEIERDSSFCVL